VAVAGEGAVAGEEVQGDDAHGAMEGRAGHGEQDQVQEARAVVGRAGDKGGEQEGHAGDEEQRQDGRAEEEGGEDGRAEEDPAAGEEGRAQEDHGAGRARGASVLHRAGQARARHQEGRKRRPEQGSGRVVSTSG
jgi:hypothetical protein